MVPIRKGDGTGVVPQGIAEVRKGDGTVIFSGAVPDSVVAQYYATTWTQGDPTWVDDVGANDITFTGDPQATTLSDGSESITGDGGDDYGTALFPVDGATLQSFSVEFSLQYTTTNTDYLIGSVNNTDQNLQILLNADGSGATGQIRLTLKGSDGNQLVFYPTNNPNLNDGNRHDISFIVNDSSTNDADIIIDGSSVAVSFNLQQSPSTFTTWDYDGAYFARNVAGTVQDESNVDMGAVRWHDTNISSQTISDYP